MAVEKLYCYLCGIEDPAAENGILCTDCKGHIPEGTQLEDWLDPTIVAGYNEHHSKKKTPLAPAAGKTTSGYNNYANNSGSTWNAKSGGTGTVYKKPCNHPGREPLFKLGKRSFCPANSGGVDIGEVGAVAVIDCAGVARRNSAMFVDGTDKYKVLNGNSKRDLIRLHWTDMSTPPLGRKFWRELTRLLPEGRIVVCCIGGHGRTGTALASLLVANGRMTADEAIDFVRSDHCDRAIETQGQEKYIRSLQTKRQQEKNVEYLAQFELAEVVDEREEMKLVPGSTGGTCPSCGMFPCDFSTLGCLEDPCATCQDSPCSKSELGCYDVREEDTEEDLPGQNTGGTRINFEDYEGFCNKCGYSVCKPYCVFYDVEQGDNESEEPDKPETVIDGGEW